MKTASDLVLTQFERPADQSEEVKDTRFTYSNYFYNKFAVNNDGTGGNGVGGFFDENDWNGIVHGNKLPFYLMAIATEDLF